MKHFMKSERDKLTTYQHLNKADKKSYKWVEHKPDMDCNKKVFYRKPLCFGEWHRQSHEILMFVCEGLSRWGLDVCNQMADEILMSVFKQTTNNVVKPQCSIVFIVPVDGIFRGHHYIRGRGPIGIYRDEKLFHIQAPLKYFFFYICNGI